MFIQSDSGVSHVGEGVLDTGYSQLHDHQVLQDLAFGTDQSKQLGYCWLVSVSGG